ncbi:uncharacterized protein [Physcomitrium patens]|uniref:Uncharacterized protein n=1 Tax=Physcomitrium patens TaxID=3218 RepID=A0A2K1JDX3_PHYPA|nr:uncharacterized protein LOC112292247 [Physcomitrium patens]XP_024396310.1 uncharacterized protein LOC112292247 [Physcomitrium patens]XP_024396311.1 uncharacterized protein LOC112292247 [Physcomitrium patens]PNR39726.1 hypothetical protein PHYPA_020005 [Physcomitrium patens]|eukprot:XP_024396309.1 uncharacterized protein LOC112292247 [Physcomitrella patens]
MSGCQNRYGSAARDECSRNYSSSVFYFISTIAAMVVLGSITVLFFCCVYCKRRRLTQRLRNARNRVQQMGSDHVMYVWPGAADETSGSGAAAGARQTQACANSKGNVAKGSVAGAEPVSCVIMAGEERPTHLARPLPREELADAISDGKLDDLERGMRREPSNR